MDSTGCLVKVEFFAINDVRQLSLCSCRGPVIVFILDFGTPLDFSFLTTVFRSGWIIFSQDIYLVTVSFLSYFS